jgi:hypothetical protein
MPFVKCSVDGCSTKLQPIAKLDPRDRETWLYRECDVCFRPACEKHSTEIDGRIVCDRCRREGLLEQSAPLLDLGLERLGPPDSNAS